MCGGCPARVELRGHTFAEAVLKVDSYLDEAALAAIGGAPDSAEDSLQGRLRSAKHPHVASFRQDIPMEGGTGVTVK